MEQILRTKIIKDQGDKWFLDPSCVSQTNLSNPQLTQKYLKIPAKKSRACSPVEISIKCVVYQH